MTLTIILVFVFIAIAGLANAGMDFIKFKPMTFAFRSDWWLSKGEYLPAKRSWLLRYVFYFLADGWHFLKLIMVLSVAIAVATAAYAYEPESGMNWFLIVAIAYFSFSGAHLLGYYWVWESH